MNRSDNTTAGNAMNIDDTGHQHQQQQQQQQPVGGAPSYSTAALPSGQHHPADATGMAPPPVAQAPSYAAPPQYPPQYAPHVVAAPHFPSGAVPAYMGGPPSHYAYAAPSPLASMPPGYPPLMPLSSTHRAPSPPQWICPDHERMVMTHHHDARCAACTSYWHHYEAAVNDPQFMRAHEEARARQQAGYFAYFSRARGEGSSDEVSRLQDDLCHHQETVERLHLQLNDARASEDRWEREARSLQEDNQTIRGRLSRLQRDYDDLRRANRQAERERSRSPRPRARDDPTDRRRSPGRAGPPRGDSYRPSPPPQPSRQRTGASTRATMPPPSTPSGSTGQRRREGETQTTVASSSSSRPQAHLQVRLPAAQPEFVQGSSRSTSAGPVSQPRSVASSNASTPAAAGPTDLPTPLLNRVHGPEIVDFEGSDDEDFILSDEDGIDLKEVMRRQAKHTMRRARNKGSQQAAGKAAAPKREPKREKFSPAPGDEQPAPQPLPAAIPRSNAEWPREIPRVHPTDVRLADSWFDYVPIRHRDGQAILREAREQMAGAYQRVRHLIQQIDDYPGYMGIRGLAVVKQNWSVPRSARSEQGAAPQPPVAPSSDAARGTARVPMRQPTHMDTPEMWQQFYTLHPRSIPPALRVNPADPLAVPSLQLLRANLLFRRFVPTTRNHQSSPRAAMLDSIARVFSMHGLYDHIRNMGHYPVGPVENIQPFPPEYRIENISWHDVVRWAARCGITYDTVLMLEYVTRLYRNEQLGRPLDSVEPWPTEPRSLQDVDRAPPEEELPPMPFPSATTTDETADTMVTDEHEQTGQAGITSESEPAAGPESTTATMPIEQPVPSDVPMHDSTETSGNTPGVPTDGGSITSPAVPPTGQ